MFYKTVLKILSAFFLLVALSFPATTGKISGKITDAKTGQPLLGVNIILQNTDMGASTDKEGFYFILNVPPGKYTLSVSMIGYKKAIVKEVHVMADHTTEINVRLNPTILKGEEVVVVAERPLIQKDVTSTLRITDSEDIEQMPVQSYLDILNTSTGIISTGNEENQEIHIRGSRTGEVIYLVDGFQVDDIVYRGMATDVNTQAISELSLITGTFNAEYGEAAAAVVNIVTKEGPSFYNGNIRFLTDKAGRIFGGERFTSDFNSQRIEGTFGGPIPFMPSLANFFVSGDIYSTDTYLGRVKVPRTIIDFTQSEPFIDGNGNQIWDEGEEFTDENNNGVWDYVIGHALDGTELKKGNFRDTKTFRKENRMVGKLVMKPVKNIKLILGYNRFRKHARNYSHYYKQIPDHNAPYWEYSDLINLTINHALSPATSYQIRYSSFSNLYAEGMERFLNDKFEFDHKFYSEPFIDENGNGVWDSGEQFFDSNGNDMYDTQAEWWSYMPEPYYDTNLNGVWDENEDFIDLSGNNSYNLGLIPPLTVYIPSIGSNYEFAGSYIQYDTNGDTVRWLTSDDNFWQKYTAKTTTVGGFISSQINNHHHIKAGFDIEKHQIKNHWISGISPNGTAYHSQEAFYQKHPIQASAWIQDKIEFRDLVVQFGLRYDYLEPQGDYLRDPWNPYVTVTDSTGQESKVLDLVTAKPKIQISPRIGFGYPVTDRTLFRFSYGKFFQNPGFDRFWRRINESGATLYNFAQGYIPTFGNPNLKPQSTTAYEVGMEQQLATDIKLSLTLFYKDQYNYATSYIYDVDPIPYAMFVNGDYANSRGVEISLDKRFSNYWSAQINYTFSRAEGNADDEWTHWDEAYSASVYGTFPPKKTITMPWDQPHTLNFIVTYQKPSDYGFTLIGNLGSGLPYTPTDARGRSIDETNSARKPPTVNIDLRTNKDFRFNKFRIRLFADIYNLINYRNVIWVFSNSGKPNQSTNPNTSLDNEDRPHYYGAPRHIEVGIDFIFDQRGGK